MSDERWEGPEKMPIDANAAEELLELAWGIIANAGGGDWSKESEEWQKAAKRWRNKYHSELLVIDPKCIVSSYDYDGKRLDDKVDKTEAAAKMKYQIRDLDDGAYDWIRQHRESEQKEFGSVLRKLNITRRLPPVNEEPQSHDKFLKALKSLCEKPKPENWFIKAVNKFKNWIKI